VRVFGFIQIQIHTPNTPFLDNPFYQALATDI
jgi:hypothetical protein